MVYAYLRISTSKQDLEGQELSILKYCQDYKTNVDHFLRVEASTRKTQQERRIPELMAMLKAKDILIVAELSRLGRSISQVVSLVDELVKNKIGLICIKENIILKPNGKKDLQSTVMVSMFSLFAEVERTLISERTIAGLQAARAKGKQLGRPLGARGRSVLDGKESMIMEELRYGVAVSAIARKMGVSRGSLINFVKTRGLKSC